MNRRHGKGTPIPTICRRMCGERQNTSSTANAVPLLPLEKANVQTNARGRDEWIMCGGKGKHKAHAG